MPYTHTVVDHPSLSRDQLQQRQGWNQLHLVGEIRTAQAATFVFESESPLGLTASLDLLQAAREIWHLYGNCDGKSRRQQSSSL
jgi:hypothetical protein